MIVKMKKLTLLSLAYDRAATLDALRELGVLHVTPVVAPSSAHLEEAREKATGLRRLLDAIPADAAVKKTGRDVFAVMADTAHLLEQEKEWRERLEAVEAEIARVEPFGAVEPGAIKDLREKGRVCSVISGAGEIEVDAAGRGERDSCGYAQNGQLLGAYRAGADGVAGGG